MITRTEIRLVELNVKGRRAMEHTIPRHTGVPSFFRACCYEASLGGVNTYRLAAWHLTIHLYDQVPDNAEIDDWEKHVERLRAACGKEDEDIIWDWFKRYYPKCMRLVPSRRKKQFTDGVLDAYREGRMP
jgi:hypothetical protein